MKLSVITAFYNSERFLRATVESVARQTMPPDEHILVDDASTDGSLALAEQLAREYAYVRVICHETNKGYPAALNTGITATKADFVAILDADDIALPNWIETVMPIISEDPVLGAVGGGCIIMSEQGHITGHRMFCEVTGDVTALAQDGKYAILHPGTIFRRSYLDLVGGYNPRFNSFEDVDIYLSLSHSARLIHVGHPLVYYRRCRGSESRKSKDYGRLSTELIKSKSELLKQGYSISDANDLLDSHIETLKTVPRLEQRPRGTYYCEMAGAFEIGGRRWMAALNYLSALSYGHKIRETTIGFVRCMIPLSIWQIGKKVWNTKFQNRG